MKLDEFLKIQNNNNILESNLVSTYGHSNASVNEVWNKIYNKVKESLASKCDEAEIKEIIDQILIEYELSTPELEEQTKTFMKNMGFKFDEDEL